MKEDCGAPAARPESSYAQFSCLVCQILSAGFAGPHGPHWSFHCYSKRSMCLSLPRPMNPKTRQRIS